jgi:hypothetical protein
MSRWTSRRGGLGATARHHVRIIAAFNRCGAPIRAGIVDKFTGTSRLCASPSTLENDFTVGFARFARCLALIRHDGAESGPGFDLLAVVCKSSAQERLSMTMLPAIDAYLACATAHDGDLDGAVELSRRVVDGLVELALLRLPVLLARTATRPATAHT